MAVTRVAVCLLRRNSALADLSGLPDDIVYVLRNGKLPPGVTLPTAEGEQAPDAEEAHASDAERLRASYHQMVEEKIADWFDDHPDQGRRLPDAVRQQIEDSCNRQIQYEWRQLLQRDEGDEGR